jgi:DoxX-like family
MTNIKQSKLITIIYWSFIVIFSLFMLMDGVAGVLRVEAGKEALAHLGYPEYMLTIVGTAKILGAIAIIQNKFKSLKEWAFAGFTINALGAFGSRFFVGDTGFLLFFPVFLVGYTLAAYYIWKKFENRSRL